MRLMAETGMRAGECASLVVADVDTLHGGAVVRAGKGARDRPVPFGPQTAAVLDRYLRARRAHAQAGRAGSVGVASGAPLAGTLAQLSAATSSPADD